MHIHTITNYPEIELHIVAVILVVMAVLIWIGKGDWLIAGYNTASKKQKERFNIVRLRRVMACFLVFAALFVMSLLWLPQCTEVLTIIFVVVMLLALSWVRIWAERKDEE